MTKQEELELLDNLIASVEQGQRQENSDKNHGNYFDSLSEVFVAPFRELETIFEKLF